MTKPEFKIDVKVKGNTKGKLNLVSDINNIDYILEMVKEFLTEWKEKEGY